MSSDADPRAPRGGDVLMADNPVRILVIYGGGRRAGNFARATASFDGGVWAQNLRQIALREALPDYPERLYIFQILWSFRVHDRAPS